MPHMKLYVLYDNDDKKLIAVYIYILMQEIIQAIKDEWMEKNKGSEKRRIKEG